MKISSFLLAGLLAGQAMPIAGMHSNFFQLVKNQINATRMTAQQVAHVLGSNPSLIAKVAVGEFALAGIVCGLAYLYSKNEIGYKIGCAMGKYSLDSQLVRAAAKGDLVAMEKLLNQGADPNVNVYSRGGLLQTAIQQNDEKMLDLAIKAGADVNALNFLYDALITHTPFSKNMAKKLIEAGANPDGIVEPGLTVKEWAVMTGDQDYIDVFKPETKLL